MNQKQEMMLVYIPGGREGEESFVRVGVNGRMYQVPRGRNVEVPRCVYDLLRVSEQARAVTEAYDDAHRQLIEDRRA